MGWSHSTTRPAPDADGFAVRRRPPTDLGLETMTDVAAVADQLTWGLAA